jgi:hypothetical protein
MLKTRDLQAGQRSVALAAMAALLVLEEKEARRGRRSCWEGEGSAREVELREMEMEEMLLSMSVLRAEGGGREADRSIMPLLPVLAMTAGALSAPPTPTATAVAVGGAVGGGANPRSADGAGPSAPPSSSRHEASSPTGVW